jgi:alpha-galactosidase
MIGAHVGPPTAHTTGRTHTLGFRAATALFGHFGVEWDISSASEQDRAQLAEVIALYRRLRPMLHTGTTVNTDHPDPSATLSGIVAADRSAALFSYAQLSTGTLEAPAPVRFAGLDGDRRYTVTLVEPVGKPGTTGDQGPAWTADGSITLTGTVLQTTGLALPVLQPEQALLLELVAG